MVSSVFLKRTFAVFLQDFVTLWLLRTQNSIEKNPRKIYDCARKQISYKRYKTVGGKGMVGVGRMVLVRLKPAALCV